MRRILVLNLGSTSFKFKLYNMDEDEILLASGGVESIGAQGAYRIWANGREEKARCRCQTHIDALEWCMGVLSHMGVSVDMASLDAVGYKAVHGGGISGSRAVDGPLMAEMERMCALAPAHNPVYLEMMRRVKERYPGLKQIACFETAFHATVPLERTVYGIPYAWMEQLGIRRYGFHGSSHSYIAWKMAQEAPQARRLVSVHLGGSSSLCAIQDGRSIATSMGATPQSGLFHNNRVGDLDVFCLPVIIRQTGGVEAAMKALSAQSGLLGLSGVSNDMRKVKEAAAQGDERAQLAIRAFVDEIVGYIGRYTAYLGGLDAICFTGGIGLNDASLRQRVADRLSFVNAKLNPVCNKSGYEGRISAADSGVAIWAFETNEEIMVARGCMRVLNA